MKRKLESSLPYTRRDIKLWNIFFDFFFCAVLFLLPLLLWFLFLSGLSLEQCAHTDYWRRYRERAKYRAQLCCLRRFDCCPIEEKKSARRTVGALDRRRSRIYLYLYSSSCRLADAGSQYETPLLLLRCAVQELNCEPFIVAILLICTHSPAVVMLAAIAHDPEMMIQVSGSVFYEKTFQ